MRYDCAIYQSENSFILIKNSIIAIKVLSCLLRFLSLPLMLL